MEATKKLGASGAEAACGDCSNVAVMRGPPSPFAVPCTLSCEGCVPCAPARDPER